MAEKKVKVRSKEFNGEFEGKKKNQVEFFKLYPCEFILNQQRTAIIGWKK